MSKLRLAAVSFLNARPITYGLERDDAVDSTDFDIPPAAPRRWRGARSIWRCCPSPATPPRPRTAHRPGRGGGRPGPVRTVLLVGEVPWEQMTDIALDSASRSSALLLRLLTAERGLAPRFDQSEHEGILEAARGTRGALVIGDRGFQVAERLPPRLRPGRRVGAR